MGKQINVSSFDDMAVASKKLQEDSVNYMDIYKQLLNAAQTMGAAYEGADNLAFVEQITGFTDELKSMSDKLSQMSQIIDTQRANSVARQDTMTDVKKLQN